MKRELRRNQESSRSSASQSEGREKILDAARMLFASLGFEATSIRRIATELNMVSASLYYHFPTKEDILHEILVEPLRDLREKLTAIAADGRDAETRLVATIALRFQAWVEHWEAHAIAADQAYFFTVKEGFEYLEEAMEKGYRALETILEDGVREGLFRPEINRYFAISTIHMTLNSAAKLFKHGHGYRVKPPVDIALEDIAKIHTDFILRMVRATERISEPIPLEPLRICAAY